MLDLSEEEMDQIVDRMVAELMQKENNRKEFVKNRQDESMKLLCEHLLKDGKLDNDDVYDDSSTIAMSGEEFSFLFDNLMDYSEDVQKQAVDPECDFTNKMCFVKHEDVLIQLFIMWGQGTYCTFNLIEEADPNYIFSYEDMRQFYIKEAEVDTSA